MSLWASQDVEPVLLNDSLVDLRVVQVLRWPSDKGIIASLSLEEKMCWFAGQEPRYMIFLGNDPEFKRFWKRYYLRPLHLKRFFYRIKNVIRTYFRAQA